MSCHVSNIVINHINYDGIVRKTESDEYIVIGNDGEETLDISGWRLNAGDEGQDFIFPEGTVLAGGESFRVYTNETHASTGGFSFGSGRAIWNNEGDEGYLFDDEGNLVESLRYVPVVISDINYDGVVKWTESDEYAVITNQGKSAVNIGGWRLNAGDRGQDFIFPAGTILEASASFRVYTNEIHPETGGFSFGSGRAIWNNKGDEGYLFDNEENLVSSYSYSPTSGT